MVFSCARLFFMGSVRPTTALTNLGLASFYTVGLGLVEDYIKVGWSNNYESLLLERFTVWCTNSIGQVQKRVAKISLTQPHIIYIFLI